MSNPTIELVQFRLKAGVDDATFLAAAEAFNTMPEVAAFADMIDFSTTTMLHLAQLRSFEV